MSRLTLVQANKIIEVALAKAREMKVKPLAVAVLDEAGHVRALQREDEASMLRNDVAIGKAWAAVGMGVASRTLLDRAKGNPHFFGALSATAQGKFIPQTGAVVIKDKDGTSEAWNLEGGSPSALARDGWSSKSLKSGDQIRLTVEPLRSGAPGGAWNVNRIKFIDGQPIVPKTQ